MHIGSYFGLMCLYNRLIKKFSSQKVLENNIHNNYYFIFNASKLLFLLKVE